MGSQVQASSSKLFSYKFNYPPIYSCSFFFISAIQVYYRISFRFCILSSKLAAMPKGGLVTNETEFQWEEHISHPDSLPAFLT